MDEGCQPSEGEVEEFELCRFLEEAGRTLQAGMVTCTSWQVGQEFHVSMSEVSLRTFLANHSSCCHLDFGKSGVVVVQTNQVQ